MLHDDISLKITQHLRDLTIIHIRHHENLTSNIHLTIILGKLIRKDGCQREV